MSGAYPINPNDDTTLPIPNYMELHTLLANFAQRNSMKYEDMLQKANRIIDGGYNELLGWGIQIEGGTRDEREESLRKELEKRYA